MLYVAPFLCVPARSFCFRDQIFSRLCRAVDSLEIALLYCNYILIGWCIVARIAMGFSEKESQKTRMDKV